MRQLRILFWSIAHISETISNEIDRENKVNGIDNERTSLKPEPTSNESELNSANREGVTCNKGNEPFFNVNEATKDASIVESSENPYYEGMWILT